MSSTVSFVELYVNTGHLNYKNNEFSTGKLDARPEL